MTKKKKDNNIFEIGTVLIQGHFLYPISRFDICYSNQKCMPLDPNRIFV